LLHVEQSAPQCCAARGATLSFLNANRRGWIQTFFAKFAAHFWRPDPTMHPDLEQLIPLQQMDVTAQQLRETIAAAPKRVREAEARVKDASARRTAIGEELAKEEALRRRLESDISDLKVKLEKARKKLDGATTTAQVTALEHEVSFDNKEISRLEDVELESMERAEALESKLPTLDAELREAQAVRDRVRQQADESVAQSKAELGQLDKRREELRAAIPKSDTGEASLSRYDRIAKARGTAIAEVKLGKCMACGMMVRPQLWQDLRDNSADSPSRTELATCENCGRMLYYDPAQDAPQRKPVKGESIAASIVRSSI
jgi:predicted  nucleic acid-binding Zn-ribbon protein